MDEWINGCMDERTTGEIISRELAQYLTLFLLMTGLHYTMSLNYKIMYFI